MKQVKSMPTVGDAAVAYFMGMFIGGLAVGAITGIVAWEGCGWIYKNIIVEVRLSDGE
jgi:hypothetical protein